MHSMQAHKAHSLIGQVYDPRNLARAWERVKENKGAGGVDGVTVTRFDENREHYLSLLHQLQSPSMESTSLSSMIVRVCVAWSAICLNNTVGKCKWLVTALRPLT